MAPLSMIEVIKITKADFYGSPQGWIGYKGTHVTMFVHKLGLIEPRQT